MACPHQLFTIRVRDFRRVNPPPIPGFEATRVVAVDGAVGRGDVRCRRNQEKMPARFKVVLSFCQQFQNLKDIKAVLWGQHSKYIEKFQGELRFLFANVPKRCFLLVKFSPKHRLGE